MQPRILYFAPEWRASSSGILHSIVLAEAAFLHRHGMECLFVGADVGAENARLAEKNISARYGIPARVLECSGWSIPLLSDYLRPQCVRRLARDVIRSFQPTHVWTGFFPCAAVARRIAAETGAVSVFDVPAIFAEEMSMLHGRGLRYWVSRLLETHEFLKADRLAVVSRNLAQWVKRWTGRDVLVVVPCCVDVTQFHVDDETRRCLRIQLGFAEKKVICYSGGLSEWQRVGDIADLFCQVLRIRDEFRCLFLTQAAERLMTMLRQREIPQERCVVKRCLPHEVPRYLSTADSGIIMRKNMPVNNLASPIKIGEYLACGLPVIFTKGIGDYSEALSAADAGLVLNEEADMAQQVVEFMERPDFTDVRNRARQFALQQVSWEAHLELLRSLFAVAR